MHNRLIPSNTKKLIIAACGPNIKSNASGINTRIILISFCYLIDIGYYNSLQIK